MSETVLVLRADRYEFTSEKTGEIIKGANVYFISDTQVETPNAVGDKPMKVAISDEVFNDIKHYGAPAIYDITTKTRPGKDGTATVTLVKAKFQQPFKLPEGHKSRFPMFFHAPCDIYGPELLRMFIDELGGPKQVHKYLDVSERTVWHWLSTGRVPRAAVLALFWESRWGRSQIFTEQVNEIQLRDRQVCSRQGQYQKAKDIVAGLRAIHAGSANEPLFEELPIITATPAPTFSAEAIPPATHDTTPSQPKACPTGQCRPFHTFAPLHTDEAPTVESPLFLTGEELATLTGFKTPARQVEWLRTKGWRFEINGNRRAIVARKYAEKMLGCGGVMGRRRQSNFDDPPRFHRKGNVWYHVSGTLPRVWSKLSNDRAEALRLWAQREGVREDESTRVFSVVARRYVREVFPTKSVQTRRDNDKELANLLRVFGHMPIEAIAPMHIRQYMDLRGQVAKVR
eukprot:gene39947-52734_t